MKEATANAIESFATLALRALREIREAMPGSQKEEVSHLLLDEISEARNELVEALANEELT